MSDSVLRNKSKKFAKDIVFLCRKLKQNGVEGALINNFFVAELPSAQTFMRHSMLKEQKILSQNLKLHLKNVMRVNIGLNSCMKQIA